jgi:hypothetical protein
MKRSDEQETTSLTPQGMSAVKVRLRKESLARHTARRLCGTLTTHSILLFSVFAMLVPATYQAGGACLPLDAKFCCSNVVPPTYLSFSVPLPTTSVGHRVTITVAGGTVRGDGSIDKSNLCRWYVVRGGSQATMECNARACRSGQACPGLSASVEIDNPKRAALTVTHVATAPASATPLTLLTTRLHGYGADGTKCKACGGATTTQRIVLSTPANRCTTPLGPKLSVSGNKKSTKPLVAWFKTSQACISC